MAEINLEKRKFFPGFGGAFLLVIGIVLLSITVGLTIRGVSFSEDSNTNQKWEMTITNSFAFGIVILIGFLISKRRAKEVFRISSPVPIESASLAITTIGLCILLSDLDNVFSLILPKPEFLLDLFRNIISGENVWITFLLLSGVAPVTEELLFRGLILDGFLRNYKRITAFLLSAFLFGLVHINPWQFISGFIVGIYLAWIAYETGSIFQAILIHAIFNGLPVFLIQVFQWEIPGFTVQAEYGEPQALQPAWLDIAGLLIFAIGMMFTLFLFEKRKPIEAEISG